MTNSDRDDRRAASAGADPLAAPQAPWSLPGGSDPPDEPAGPATSVPAVDDEPAAADVAGVGDAPPAEESTPAPDDDGAAPLAGTEGEPTGTVGGDACPYLAAEGGGWRSLEAVRDHRCGALDPPAIIALEKQRRLCLGGAHVRCPTYVAAREARVDLLATVPEGWSPERRFVRTTPVVIQAGPGRPSRSVAIGRQRLVEVAVAVLAIVVVVLIGTRILGGDSSRIPPDTSPATSPVAGAGSAGPGSSGSSTAPGSDGPDVTAGASTQVGSPAPSADASAGPDGSAGPAPSSSPKRTTYRVKKGDTISGIAARYGVTVSAIVKANKIKNASNIHVGQVLVIPSPAP